MCAFCNDWTYATTVRYMAQTGVHLEIALRLVRDTVIQNALHDQEELTKSDEVVMQEIRGLTELMDKTAERMRAMQPSVLAALVAMVDSST